MSPPHPLRFELGRACPHTRARTGRVTTPHGSFDTPVFMPVGTRGTVKGLTPAQLAESGTTILLANTYHLHLRPGEDVVRELGGLHAFMGWSGPILTDSGGYQVFSMADISKVDDDGVTFRSIVDGAKVRFTPERVMDVQLALGPDVAMAFDHCPSVPTDRAGVEAATSRTHRWWDRCVQRHREAGGPERGQALFGIVQGGAFEDLRRSSVEAICSHDVPGYAVGGVSVGEDRSAMLDAVEAAAPLLPEDKPRYLMGVGTPLDFVDAVERGIDMFDCVTPSRHGRNHQAFTSIGRINLRNRVWQTDTSPLDPNCDCHACTRFSVGALSYFCKAGEMIGGILVSIHNLHFFPRLLADVRRAIETDTLPSLRDGFERAQRRVGQA